MTWSDEPPTKAGWYWVDISGCPHKAWATESHVIGWLKPTGWKIPFVGFGLSGEYMREIGAKFGPLIPSADELVYQQFINEFLSLVAEHEDNCSYWWVRESSGKLAPVVNTNDLFAWGCADCEEVTPANIHELRKAYDDCKAAYKFGRVYGTTLFACRVNKMRPQGAAYPRGEAFELLAPLLNACGPEREVGHGNPYAPGCYKPEPRTSVKNSELVELRDKAAKWDAIQKGEPT